MTTSFYSYPNFFKNYSWFGSRQPSVMMTLCNSQQHHSPSPVIDPNLFPASVDRNEFTNSQVNYDDSHQWCQHHQTERQNQLSAIYAEDCKVSDMNSHNYHYQEQDKEQARMSIDSSNEDEIIDVETIDSTCTSMISVNESKQNHRQDDERQAGHLVNTEKIEKKEEEPDSTMEVDGKDANQVIRAGRNESSCCSPDQKFEGESLRPLQFCYLNNAIKIVFHIICLHKYILVILTIGI